jgi:hypothetical protein
VTYKAPTQEAHRKGEHSRPEQIESTMSTAPPEISSSSTSSTSSESDLASAQHMPTDPSISMPSLKDDSSSSSTSTTRGRRPAMNPRTSSRRSIKSTNSAYAEDDHDPNDARYMSPRRSSAEIDRMSSEARQVLESQAKQLQSSLLRLVEMVENERGRNERLEGENRFLQSYIGELMATSKITATSSSKRK